MKCSFCEAVLACKQCGKRFTPRRQEIHVAAYQPDMQIHCPECQAVLRCKSCGYIYGELDDEEAEPEV